MNVGIVGLGLIGGSFAKTFKENTNHKVFGLDINKLSLQLGFQAGVIDSELTYGNLHECDLVILALYPSDTIDYLIAHAHLIKKGALVIDTCGVKRLVCTKLEQVASENGFLFIGGHPMAGIEHSGFSYSSGALFRGASMIFTPGPNIPQALLNDMEALFQTLGFGSICVTTPDVHDEMIAYTSQLAHVLSSAYVKTEAALTHRGFSAGSFRDMTRVARLNETMWTELFLYNSDHLSAEIDGLAQRLMEYSAAIKKNDKNRLFFLLREGRLRKEQIEPEVTV